MLRLRKINIKSMITSEDIRKLVMSSSLSLRVTKMWTNKCLKIEREERGSRSASFAYAVDDLRVIADNEEGKREDRFLNLIRG